MQSSIFAMQVVLPLQQPKDYLYGELHKLIASAPPRAGYQQMHDYYGRISRLLAQSSNRFERGVWDYWDDPSRAMSDYLEWVDGLQGREARHTPAPEDGRPRYLACTLALLIEHRSISDRRLFDHCNIHESRLWERATFVHLLEGVRKLNFLHVQSDLVYLLPGDDPACGLTEEDLAGEDFHYLRRLS